jgi:AcrR family transcriptional regulator
MILTDVSVSSRPVTDQLPTTERQWIRRAELLEAARRVFERDGYHAATVSDIVRAAGLSQGAFYLYFPDKKAIFAALQEEMATLLRRRIYWATREHREPGLKILGGLTAYFEFYAEYRDWNRRLEVEGLGIDPDFEARQQQLHETLAEGFRPTFEAAGIADPVVAAFALIGMANRLAYWRHVHPAARPLRPDQLARACAALFLHGATHLDEEATHA